MGVKIIKVNGNGEATLNIPIALLAVIVTILVASVPFVVAWGVINEKVDNIEKDQETLDEECAESQNRHDERISQLEKIASANEVSLANIEKDISEIKVDVKELRRGSTE